MPEGAFYLFVNCQGMYGKITPEGKPITDDFAFASYLLDAAKVGTVHGSAFGAPGYLRIAYAVNDEVLADACQRLEQVCAQLR
jgi:aspartate aminotransferase